VEQRTKLLASQENVSMYCANAGKEKQQKELLEEKTALKRPR
jgi:hypothetical protein